MADRWGKTEPDTRREYGDIIDLPHHTSLTREHMSMEERAAQFAPFAALTGFEEMIEEQRAEIDEDG